MESKKFHTILADPPWDINQRGNLGAERHYPLMTLGQIKAMPVGDLAEDNAHLWLWVTNGTMRQGHEVAEQWGFQTKSILTWVKWQIGLGQNLRNATEHLLFATRGRAPVKFRSQPTWFFASRQAHSQKPDEQFAVIERISPGPYLELFARRKPASRNKWAVWGNEVASDITIPGYPVPPSIN